MKVKTSITLSQNILEEIDKILNPNGNRSLFIERALIEYINHHKKLHRDEADLEIINSKFQKLNEEAEDILSFQVGI